MAKQNLKDVRAALVAQLVEQMKAGATPWVRPWRALGAHRNGVSGRPYRGENVATCMVSSALNGFTSHEWYTFQQALAAGGCVRKGEKGTLLSFWKRLPKKESAEGAEGDAQDDKDKSFLMARWFTVFNRDQIEGLPEPKPLPAFDEDSFVNPAATALVVESGAKVVEGGGEAYYSPSSDEVHMPPREQFQGDKAASAGSHYWGTLLHEMTHWTGHASRENRDQTGHFGSPKYAFEELIAELGSAFLCQHLGVDGSLRHAGYLQSWIKVLTTDPTALTRAIQAAQTAADSLLPKQSEEAEIAA